MKKTLIKSIALLASLGSLASCNSLTSQGNNSNTSNKDIISQSQSIIAKQATTGLEAMKLLTNSPQTFNSVMKARENNSTQISSQDQETITKLLNQFDFVAFSRENLAVVVHRLVRDQIFVNQLYIKYLNRSCRGNHEYEYFVK